MSLSTLDHCRSPIRSTARIVVALAVFALGLAATALFVALVVNPLVRPARDTGMHRENLAALQAVALQIDVLVIGTSRVATAMIRSGRCGWYYRVLEAGVQLVPRYAQLRADYIGARMLAGQTEAYGTRKSVAEELEELLKMRRPSPLIWHEALAWLRSEAKLPKEQAERLDRAIAPLARPDLDQEALNGR